MHLATKTTLFTRALFALVLAASGTLACPGVAEAGINCVLNFAIFDYFENGVYQFSNQEPDGYTCERSIESSSRGGLHRQREAGDGRDFSSDEFSSNEGAANTTGLVIGQSPGQTCPTSGNPIVLPTGNKIEPEVDFGSSGEMALHLKRTYNHYWQGAGLFGKHWLSNFDYKLSFGSTSLDSCYPRPGGGTCALGSNTVIYAWRPDGRMIEYLKNATDGIFYEDKSSPVSRIVKQADGSFILYGEDNFVETYSSAGYVNSIQDERGIRWTYSYSGTFPTRVTHTSGRYVEFTWTSGQLTAVRDTAGNSYSYTYNANQFGTGLHRLATASRPGSSVTTLTYHYELGSDPSALTGKSFNGARYSTFNYDPSGYAWNTFHNGLERFSFSYTLGPDNVLSVIETNPLGKQATYTFKDGKPLTITGHPSSNCPTTSYAETTYDANGYPQLKSDFNGNTTTFAYNAKGQLIQKVEAYGTPIARKTSYVWDTVLNRIVSVTVGGVAAGSDLVRTSYTYTADNRIASVTVTNLSAKGVTNQTHLTTYAYTKHPNGMLATMAVDGPLSADTVTYAYNATGDLTSVTNSLGHATTYSSYNALGLPGRTTGPNGDMIDYTYDARGRITKIRTYPNGVAADANYTYNGSGQLATLQTPDGVTTVTEYDIAQRMTRKYIDSTGILAGDGIREEQRYDYNPASDIIQTSNYATEGHYETQYNFRCLRPVGGTEANCLEPDYVEVQTWVVSPVQKQSAFTDYDELSRPRASRGNNGQNVRYTYDDNGNTKTVTDSLGKVTTLTYDALDRLIQSKDPLNGITVFEYDAASQLTKVTDPRGGITTYAYDGFGQLWAQSSPDTGAISFDYSAAGLRTKMTRADGVATTYSYDGLGRLTGVTASGQTHVYGYDACSNGKGRLCQVTNAGSTGSIAYTYTPQGQIATQTPVISGGATSFATGYSYDAMGRLTNIAYPGGVSTGYGYVSGKLKTMTVNINGTVTNFITDARYLPYGPALSWTYGNGLTRLLPRDLDGRLATTFTKNGTTAIQNPSYTYDANDQITKITNGINANLTQTYGYDALGRLTSVVATNANQGWAYDSNGNRSSHTWNGQTDIYSTASASNRLTGITGPRPKSIGTNANGSLTANAGASYTYNAFGRLTAVVKSGATTNYWVNALGQRTYKTQGSPQATEFLYGTDGQLLAEYHQANGWTRYLWMGDELVGVIKGSTLYYVHGDHLGRPELATNGAKAVVWQASNYAFDRTVTLDQIGGLNLGFPGQYYDAESGTWNNGMRDYDPSIGRYLQSDPIGLAGGVNTYGYVGGNPVTNIDPLGLEAGGGYSTGQYQMGQPSMSKCEAEALADFGIGAIPITAVGSFVLDLAGVDINLIDNPGVNAGNYDIGTPYAAAGHAADAIGYRYEQIAARQASRVQQPGVHYSVTNGRANRAAASAARSGIAKGVAKKLGIVGAAFGLYNDLQECGCQ